MTVRGIRRPAPLPWAVSDHAWLRYLLLGGIPVLVAPFFLATSWERTGLTLAIAYASGAACFWRFRTGRGVPLAWLLIGAGITLNASGSIWESVLTEVFHSTASPTGADALYLTIYPCLAIGLLLIARARHPGLGPAKLIDAGTLTVGMGLLCWVFIIRPAAAVDPGTSTLARMVAVAYPVGDLVLLAILARVAVTEGWRTPALRLLAITLICFFVGDTLFAIMNEVVAATTNLEETWFGEAFLLGYALVGAAALHRSTDKLDTEKPPDTGRVSPTLFASVTISSLVVPGVLAGESLTGRPIDGIAIAISSVLLTVLIVARMGFLLRQVQRQATRLRDLALEDPLTGLPNRRALETRVATAMQHSARERQPLTVAMLDLDFFKNFNDEYGHLAGDQLLKGVAAAWSAQLRGTDTLARVGGEEFVLVLNDVDLNQAELVVRKLCEVTPLGQTFSAGLSQWIGETIDELLAKADVAMYEAKRGGRNRIERAGPQHLGRV